MPLAIPGSLSLLAVLGCASPPPARVALTIDDFPYQTLPGGAPAVTDPAERARVHRALASTLASRSAPATVFVNCGHVAPDEVATLAAWRDAGIGLGNHTWSHRGVRAGETDAWAEDLGRCDTWLREHLHAGGAIPFRYPYLRQGTDVATREAVAVAVRAAGERPAPVTLSTSEWLLAERYDAAVARGDAALQAELAAEYVAHMVGTVRLGRAWAREGLGRDVPHVTLVHVNRLTADHLGAALDAMRADGVELVPLDDALADEIYARPSGWVGGSMSWLGHVGPLPAGGDPFAALDAAYTGRFPAR